MDGDSFKKTLRKRSWNTAKLAAQLGLAAASKTIGLELPQSNEQALAKAVALAQQFDGMKGLMLKFGQMASYLNTGLPPQAQQAVATLQSAATAMPYGDVLRQIETSFAVSISELFEEFTPDAFAAASIGQVHRAVHKGHSVAVKVQYPGIRQLIENDLKNVGFFSQLIFATSKMDGAGMAEELSTRILEECNYQLEAQRQHAIGAVWNQCAGRVVPQVYFERSNPVILTSSFEHGTRFSDYIANASAEERRNSSLIIFEAIFEGIFHHGFFNGDPHPGNYLFRENGAVVFLDFGCLRSFDDAFLQAWKPMAQAVLDNNRPRFKECFTAMGMVGNAKKFDWDFQWEMMLHLYEPFRSTKPYRYSKEYVKESYEKILWHNKNRWHLTLPPNQLFVNRLQWGLNSVLADLNAEAIYCDIFRAAVESKVERIPGLS